MSGTKVFWPNFCFKVQYYSATPPTSSFFTTEKQMLVECMNTRVHFFFGPTLFPLYINDLPDGMIGKLVMYVIRDINLLDSTERPKASDQLRH